MREQEIADLRRSIESLDASRDELQSELDAKTEELTECRLQLER
jgi:prefoldin subunit 5